MGSRGRTLLNPRFDYESCGVGLVADLSDKSSHNILRLALTALGRLGHRGAVAADRKSSDGVGILTCIPRELLLKEAAADLPAERPLAVGMLFLPQPEPAASRDAQLFRECISAHGLQWLAWRDVPLQREVLGELALDSIPIIRQALISVSTPANWTTAELEHRLYLARKAFERQTTETYVCSLSTRTIVYKAMCAGRLLHQFYPDLDSDEFVTPFAIFHQRYATNVLPSWHRAQPLRLLAHNGEINTIWSNRAHMEARRATLPREMRAHPQRRRFGFDEPGRGCGVVGQPRTQRGRSHAHASTGSGVRHRDGVPPLPRRLHGAVGRAFGFGLHRWPAAGRVPRPQWTAAVPLCGHGRRHPGRWVGGGAS